MIKKETFMKILGMFISASIVILMILSYILRDSIESYFAAEIRVSGFLISFIVAGILEAIPQLIAPHFLLLNSAILGFPSFTTFLVVASGATIGAIIGFDVGRHYGYNLACNIYSRKKVDKIKNLFNSHGRWFVTLAALSPLPYMPLVFGSLGMTRRQFYTHGIFPRVISYVVVYIFVILNL